MSLDIKTEYNKLPIDKRAQYILDMFKLGYSIYDLYKKGIPRTSLERVGRKMNINKISRYDVSEKIIDNEKFYKIDIPGYNKYLISKTGKVFSLRNNTLFKPYIDEDGYYKIGLRSSIDNKRHSFGIHELVLNTFDGKPSKEIIDPTVDHINGIKSDNRIENLRWLSRSVNGNGKHKHFSSEIHVNNRTIDDETVHKICKLLEQNYSIEEIANILKIKTNVVKSIKVGQTFRYISKNYSFFKKKEVSNRIPLEDFFNLYFDISVSITDIMKKYKCHEKVIRSLKENLYDWDNCEIFQL